MVSRLRYTGLSRRGAAISSGSELLVARRTPVLCHFLEFRDLHLVRHAAKLYGSGHCNLPGFSCLDEFARAMPQDSFRAGNASLTDFEDLGGPANWQARGILV
jgi:hypothetical protein